MRHLSPFISSLLLAKVEYIYNYCRLSSHFRLLMRPHRALSDAKKKK